MTFSQRLTRALGQLALALLNATLILVVVALFLVWRVAATVESATVAVTETASEQLARVTPVKDELSGLRSELAELRTSVAQLRSDTTIDQAAVTSALRRIDGTRDRIDDAAAKIAPVVDAVASDPGRVVDRAVATGVAQAGAWLAHLRGCTAPPPSG